MENQPRRSTKLQRWPASMRQQTVTRQPHIWRIQGHQRLLSHSQVQGHYCQDEGADVREEEGH